MLCDGFISDTTSPAVAGGSPRNQGMTFRHTAKRCNNSRALAPVLYGLFRSLFRRADALF
jgi:hypothetical protein